MDAAFGLSPDVSSGAAVVPGRESAAVFLVASVPDGGGLAAAVVALPANDLVVAATGVGAVVPPSSAKAVAVAAPVFDVELPVPAGVVAGCSLLAVSW